MYYGVELQRFQDTQLRQAYREELGVGQDDILILFMGRFNEEMGLDQILKVAPSLFEKLPCTRLLLVGARGQLAETAKLFSAKYPTRVQVLHDVPFSLQPSIYAASDIVLTPSRD